MKLTSVSDGARRKALRKRRHEAADPPGDLEVRRKALRQVTLFSPVSSGRIFALHTALWGRRAL